MIKEKTNKRERREQKLNQSPSLVFSLIIPPLALFLPSLPSQQVACKYIFPIHPHLQFHFCPSNSILRPVILIMPSALFDTNTSEANMVPCLPPALNHTVPPLPLQAHLKAPLSHHPIASLYLSPSYCPFLGFKCKHLLFPLFLTEDRLIRFFSKP